MIQEVASINIPIIMGEKSNLSPKKVIDLRCFMETYAQLLVTILLLFK